MQNKTKSQQPSIVQYIIILLLGFTFLVYEVVWNRMLSLVIGATVSASTIVLVAFMAGLGLGAYFWGRKVHKSRRPGKLLGFLSLGIGVTGLLNYFLIKSYFPSLYHFFTDNNPGWISTEILMFIVASALLMVATFFMGGVLPVISKVIIRVNSGIAAKLGRIYAFETLGSTLGGLVTGFYFLGAFGQKNTLFFAVAINVMVAIFLFFSKTYNSTNKEVNASEKRNETQKAKGQKITPERRSKMRKTAVIATFLFGLSVLGLQLIWIRIFKIYLTNTSYSFALISSLVIAGLFAGSWIYKNYSSIINSYRVVMTNALVLFGGFSALGLLLLMNMPEWIMFPFREYLGNPVTKLIIMPAVASMVVVLPPTMISGFAFPLACRMYTSGSDDVGKSVGKIVATNSVGSVIGPLLTSFVLIPFLGVGVGILVFVLVSLLGSIYIAFGLADNFQLRILKPVIVVIAAALTFVIVYKPEIQILPPSFSQVDKDVVYYKETVEASLVVSKERSGDSEVKTSYVNNAVVIGSTYDAIKAVKMIGHLPFFAGLECEDVLVVGFGIGVTTSTIAVHPEVNSIDCIELAGGLKRAAVYYNDINQDVISDPRLNFIAGDGRHYLQYTSKKYDLISSDPTHPILGSANLYSQEYFQLCYDHLNKGGMVSQYLPLHKLTPEAFQGIIKTFHSVFEHSTVWLGHTHAILIGSTDPIQIDFNSWTTNISSIGRDPVFYTNPYHLAASLMLDGKRIMNFSTDLDINTDDLSYLEFFSNDCFDQENLNKNLSFLASNRSDVQATFVNIPDPFQMDRFITGNEYFIKSSMYFQSGAKQKSLDELRKAVRTNPENQEYPFLIKFYYNVPR